MMSLILDHFPTPRTWRSASIQRAPYIWPCARINPNAESTSGGMRGTESQPDKPPKYRRSRRGCVRCRQLKLKCDESKPECKQCNERGVTCPGYRANIRWSRKHEVLPQPSSADESVTPRKRLRGQDGTSAERTRSQVSTSAPVDDELRSEQSLNMDVGRQVLPIKFQPALSSTAEMTLRPGTDNNDDLQAYTSPHELSPMMLSSVYSSAHTLSAQIPQPQPTGQSSDDRNLLSAQDQTILSIPSPRSGVIPPAPIEGPIALTRDERRQICNDPGVLLDYYFDRICYIHATFDDPNEPFRAFVGGRLKSSPLVFYCIASMAACHLFKGDQELFPASIEYHTKAVTYLAQSITALDSQMNMVEDLPDSAHVSMARLQDQLQEALLASLLLGWSSSWIDPKDLGLPHLLGARKLTEYWIKVANRSGSHLADILDSEQSFLLGAMAYWEALVAFVIDQPLDAIDYLGPFARNPQYTIPNPWSGVATPLNILIAQTGICIRQRRVLDHMERLGWARTTSYDLLASKIIASAMFVERQALDYKIPSLNAVRGLESRPDVAKDMRRCAEIRKLATLLELYRNFPELLHGPGTNTSPRSDMDSATSPSYSTMIAPLVNTSHPEAAVIVFNQRRRINALARNMLSLIEDIPAEHECIMHVVLDLIICGSVLELSGSEGTSVDDLDLHNSSLDHQLESISMRTESITRWRSVVRQRLEAAASRFGLSEIFGKAKMLLDEVWRRLDNHQPLETVRGDGLSTFAIRDNHWVDIVIDCKLETLFG